MKTEIFLAHITIVGSLKIITISLTNSPDALGGVRVFPAEDGLMPGAKQVTNFDPIAVVHITVDNVLLGAPIASLNRGNEVLTIGARGGGEGRGYLDKGEFTGALVQIVDDHLSIEVHPPLTPEQVVNT